jgi:hypothetical protein
MDERIQALLDKEDIRETLLRYFRGVDRNDLELIRSAFHPDALFELGQYRMRGDEIGSSRPGGLGPTLWRATMHVAANQTISLNGDSAVAETYALNHHFFDRDGQEHLMVRWFRYVDVLERRAGEWKISHRRVIFEWDKTDPIVERAEGFPDYPKPLRSREDLSYLEPPG